MNSVDKGLYNRLIGNSLRQEVESQQRMDATIARITGSSQTIADSYRTAPQPGHGPGKYQPRAIATSRDLISLHIPATSFDGS